ncbi:hypothetical protein EUTSA_v10005530mg [Eutrema salsugineum]|uniref:Ubiquitin-like domain-containing protein n=1 Tax=Eutrema salsugineum TaxID=72664 RepID=V4MLT5_EUTSA|nr:putative small ubiquitin-related modifier 6 [Eutrema salsugineum]ESQ32431.1 hypothetical protein EUTSA_v10005530mg [Eutrema salsugineum]
MSTMSKSNEVEKNAKVGSASTHVTLKVKGQDEKELRVFRMRRNAAMRKVMNCYSEVRGVEYNTYVFLLEDGSRIREESTPDELEIKDGDQIDAMLHQDGGFG